MRAIVQDSYGSADVLELREIDKPVPRDEEVVVRVHAAGLDRGVWHVMAGQPYLIRVMGYGLRKPKTTVRGEDVAGRVEDVGSKVTRFQPGDEVFGLCSGSFAEYTCVNESSLETRPSNLSLVHSASVPVSALSALQAVRDEGEVQPGQSVLVIGASGGVGTYAVQIAKAFGAEVTGVSSAKKADMVRSIGADHVIDYTLTDVVDGKRKYDVILDIAGNRSLSHLRRGLTAKGTLVIVGGEEGGRWLGGLDRQLRAVMISPFLSQTLRAQFPAVREGDLRLLKGLIEEGRITPVIDKTFPLPDTADAIRYMLDGRASGKIVITI
jgi:NADPH:quinone reductase-like Zn-dependent oxidoreductase